MDLGLTSAAGVGLALVLTLVCLIWFAPEKYMLPIAPPARTATAAVHPEALASLQRLHAAAAKARAAEEELHAAVVQHQSILDTLYGGK